ncbi:DoxX family protein [Nocardia sp. NPDC052278]|uniref:DoxX family protein n=1 Tax=unclassified Nocardia TaxID=2637762 RepID=UPI0036B37896
MTTIDAVLLALRVVVGGTVAAHGYNHLFGPGGLAGTTGWFASMGLAPPRVHAFLSGAGELGAGIGFALGLLTAPAAAFIVGSMAVAAVVAHRRNGFFVFKDGWEYVLVLAVVAACVAVAGPGAASLDHAVGINSRLDGWVGLAIALVGGIGGAVALLAVSWRPRRSAEQSA